MIWSSVEFVSICVYIALGNLLFLFDFMVTKVTFVFLQSFFILFFYLFPDQEKHHVEIMEKAISQRAWTLIWVQELAGIVMVVFFGQNVNVLF